MAMWAVEPTVSSWRIQRGRTRVSRPSEEQARDRRTQHFHLNISIVRFIVEGFTFG